MLTNLINKIKEHANNNKFYTGDARSHNLDVLDIGNENLTVIKNDSLNEAIGYIFSNPKEYNEYNFFDVIEAVMTNRNNPIGTKMKFLPIDLLLAKENEAYLKMLEELDFSKVDYLLVSWNEEKDEEDIDVYISILKSFLD